MSVRSKNKDLQKSSTILADAFRASSWEIHNLSLRIRAFIDEIQALISLNSVLKNFLTVFSSSIHLTQYKVQSSITKESQAQVGSMLQMIMPKNYIRGEKAVSKVQKKKFQIFLI